MSHKVHYRLVPWICFWLKISFDQSQINLDREILKRKWIGWFPMSILKGMVRISTSMYNKIIASTNISAGQIFNSCALNFLLTVYWLKGVNRGFHPVYRGKGSYRWKIDKWLLLKFHGGSFRAIIIFEN